MRNLILITSLLVSCYNSVDSLSALSSKQTSALKTIEKDQSDFSLTSLIVDGMLYPGSKINLEFDRCENQQNYNYEIINTKIDGQNVRYYERSTNSDEAIIFFHGNGDTACSSLGFANFLTSIYDKSIIVAEYPGYSEDSRKPSQLALTENALALYDHVSKSYEQIDIFAHSLGTAVANYLATERELDDMVLLAPFDSVIEVAYMRFPKVVRPIVKMALKGNVFNSIEWANRSKASRVFIAHGYLDDIVPIEKSRKLFQALLLADKHYIEMSDMAHNDIIFNRDLYKRISEIASDPL